MDFMFSIVKRKTALGVVYVYEEMKNECVNATTSKSNTLSNAVVASKSGSGDAQEENLPHFAIC